MCKYRLIVVSLALIIMGCESEDFFDHSVPILEENIIGEINFDKIKVDRSEFLYNQSNGAFMFLPYSADFLMCETSDGVLHEISGFKGEGPGKISNVFLYGFASDTSVFIYGEPKYLVYSLDGELIRSGSLDISETMPSYSIFRGTHLTPDGKIVLASINRDLYQSQVDFVRDSYTISCLDVAQESWHNTGFLAGRGVYADESFEYQQPIIDLAGEIICAVYPNDPGSIYRFTCDGGELNPVSIRIKNWENRLVSKGDNTLGFRLESFQKNTTFLQFFASKNYFLTVHIMPAEPENVSNSVEGIQNNSKYRKRYASVFSASGGDALAQIDLSDHWIVAGVQEDGNVLLIDAEDMDGVKNSTIFEYKWSDDL
ncbi:hypothetical protein FUA23_22105 [Neolewinella aurantiaca]|uniref:Uncharacterized protein n=1 Tax=Neolewinella aurantiaca TaxID=2602767 RepID=A0A5C7F0X0_9BACT|nr:hypothetical protein [Neolewinella aurantiaca]TXF81073.1 hypothetical protein FUA23_22105 [Neolewinella aurantiaca]